MFTGFTRHRHTITLPLICGKVRENTRGNAGRTEEVCEALHHSKSRLADGKDPDKKKIRSEICVANLTNKNQKKFTFQLLE